MVNVRKPNGGENQMVKVWKSNGLNMKTKALKPNSANRKPNGGGMENKWGGGMDSTSLKT